MNVLILFNPVSGSGRAAPAARGLAGALREAGHDAQPLPMRPQAGDGWLLQRLAGVDVLVVAGGDGAIHGAAPAAIEAGTPVYHLPYGTANLFAREFGMDRRARTLLASLDRFQLRRVDTGVAGGRPFVLMVSMGFDARVVHDLAAARGASISYLSYLGPIRRQLRRWRPPRIQVLVDGAPLGPVQPGLAVVANARSYAFGLNPARHADMTDGLLDVVQFPIPTVGSLFAWIGKCLIGRHQADPRLVTGRGRRVIVVADEPEQVQLDGDPPAGGVGSGTANLDVRVRPASLAVLLPPRVRSSRPR